MPAGAPSSADAEFTKRPAYAAAPALIPEDARLCKYGSKHLTDDEAIGLLEQFLNKIRFLRDWKDTSEDWNARERWVLECISSLWRSRGLYPGLLNAMTVAGATILQLCFRRKSALSTGEQRVEL